MSSEGPPRGIAGVVRGARLPPPRPWHLRSLWELLGGRAGAQPVRGDGARDGAHPGGRARHAALARHPLAPPLVVLVPSPQPRPPRAFERRAARQVARRAAAVPAARPQLVVQVAQRLQGASAREPPAVARPPLPWPAWRPWLGLSCVPALPWLVWPGWSGVPWRGGVPIDTHLARARLQMMLERRISSTQAVNAPLAEGSVTAESSASSRHSADDAAADDEARAAPHRI